MTDRDPRQRRFGVLLPVSALPGPEGIGTLGAPAEHWLEWLHRAGASCWQLLPLGPAGEGNSPYSSRSSFAGSPLLISIERLAEEDWARRALREDSNATAVDRPLDRVDYRLVGSRREGQLRALWHRFADAPAERHRALADFSQAPEQVGWLEDWALFAALTDSPLTGGSQTVGSQTDGCRSWTSWPEPLRLRDPSTLRQARASLNDQVAFEIFVQFLFFEQVATLRGRAGELGIELIGDLPFYPALDSADVWARRELFDLDVEARPLNVGGVPPDAFTELGQLWGQPVLRWEERAADCASWWIERARTGLRCADRLRLDHFRGYASYWSVPADAESAMEGHWMDGPGDALFEAVREALGGLPFVAEDLGYITDDVRELLSRLGVPGMRVLQFAFTDEQSEHLPDRVPERTVLCTATHDNDTARGWFEQLTEVESRRALGFLNGTPQTVHWDLVRAAMESPARIALAPVQDILGLGSEARINIPGCESGQWTWRLKELPGDDVTARLRRLVEASGRLSGKSRTTYDALH